MAIAAISSSPSIGGIGIIRMSGDDSFDILNKVFVPKNKGQIKGYTMKYGHIVENGTIIDEVLVSYFVKPKSYTTENMVEINCHGGIVVINKIMEILIENGVRIAEPGEFTKLAFLNGRIDLAQAESVADIINASSQKQAIASNNVLNGGLSKKLKDIKDIILEILGNIEVSIDYPEYDTPTVLENDIINMLDIVEKKINELLDTYSQGKLISDGIKTAIIGSPNAGKSSLLNCLLNEQRAIVTSIPGTTRDIIKETITLEGIVLDLIDTAGIRDSDEEIEKIGIEKSKDYMQNSDLVIFMLDSTNYLDDENIALLKEIKDKTYIICLNKIDEKNSKNIELKDKLETMGYTNIVPISAKENIGIDKLKNKVIKLYNLDNIKAENKVVITNLRHKMNLEDAIENVKKVREQISMGIPVDLISISIKDILYSLNEITGENVTDDILNNIFSRFCLGK